MKDRIIEIEKILDKKVTELSIYKESFQSIYSILLFTAESIDYKGDNDTAMDYLGRTSLIYPIIKKYAQNSGTENTTQAILKIGSVEYLENINFLIAYAHFSMLMPQIHRGTLEVKSIEGNKIKIDFPNDSVKESELIDKLYSTISLPITFSYKQQEKIKSYTDLKVKNKDFTICAKDFLLIKEIYDYHLKFSINIEVLNDELIQSKMGFSIIEFKKFVATLKSFSEYFIFLSRSYKEQINDSNSAEENDKLMSEYMEWSVCCLNYKTLGWFIGISDISQDKFDLILSYFIDIYSNNTGVDFESNSFTGEGYQPPITIIDESILFSPHALRYLLSFNNILYSINKTNRELFDNEISNKLEPVLIKQLKYLFSQFGELEQKENVNYPGSEIDLLVLNKEEKVCLSIQVKTTIAPDSSRTVARVQGRTNEALKQIEKFEKLSSDDQLNLINDNFQSDLDEIKIINLIIVRSSAGSDKGWEINKTYRILNYSMLARILCNKLKSDDRNFSNFDNEILEKQKELIDDSNWGIDYETLKIGEFEIEFPNIHFDDKKILTEHIKSFKCYPKIESSEH
ncbi:hypothetical protein [Cellulophaga baltica]|uniref:hypothetical protein n=1 Tax=Cellulophaga baltica TaxID=76594 RepID=UPI0024956662|nr:hypothetical protein [Cellulophaga baltica]